MLTSKNNIYKTNFNKNNKDNINNRINNEICYDTINKLIIY